MFPFRRSAVGRGDDLDFDFDVVGSRGTTGEEAGHIGNIAIPTDADIRVSS